jgi:hypothetical protein
MHCVALSIAAEKVALSLSLLQAFGQERNQPTNGLFGADNVGIVMPAFLAIKV